MRAGIAVLAGASGRVLLARDGMEDNESSPDLRSSPPPGDLSSVNGNAVVIDHGNGWQTRYNHLKNNSLHVKTGDFVPKGAVLGQVGMSGHSNFPHVHFEIIKNARILDPFTGRGLEEGCAGPATPLWHPKAMEGIAKESGGVLDYAFSSDNLDPTAIREGPARLITANPQTPRLLFWAHAYALQEGDRDEISITGPEGQILASGKRELDRPEDDWIRSLSIERPAGGWKKGRYEGQYTLFRRKGVISELFVTVQRYIEVR